MFRAKNVATEERYPEGNVTKEAHFAAERSILQQNMEI